MPTQDTRAPKRAKAVSVSAQFGSSAASARARSGSAATGVQIGDGSSAGVTLDFRHLPVEFRAPYSSMDGGKEMRERCVAVKRCTFCRELLSGGHNPHCVKNNKEMCAR